MRLGRITIYPIKSLDGVDRAEAAITPGGILEHDRVYAIFDDQDKVVNGKRTARVHDLRAIFDGGISEVEFQEEGGGAPERFSFDAPAAIDRWLSAFFGFKVVLRKNEHSGFPDDLAAYGPTVTSEASLQSVSRWYGELPVESVRRRFRSNLELIDGPPFCEDALFEAADKLRRFQVGEVVFFGHNPCQRCVVPTRDPVDGIPIAKFQKQFMEARQRELPAWSSASRFNHYYRFAVNTSVPRTEAGKHLRVGDPILA